MDGLYKTIAVAFPPYPHRAASYALLARQLGAIRTGTLKHIADEGGRGKKGSALNGDVSVSSSNTGSDISSSRQSNVVEGSMSLDANGKPTRRSRKQRAFAAVKALFSAEEDDSPIGPMAPTSTAPGCATGTIEEEPDFEEDNVANKGLNEDLQEGNTAQDLEKGNAVKSSL